MHPDKKTGLALGILLIGVTGAFFFRNERPQTEPRLQDPQSLDDQIAQQQGPRPHIDLERPQPIDDDSATTASRAWSPLTGSRQTESPPTTGGGPHDVREPDLPASRTMPPDKLAKSSAPPDPIPTAPRRRENDPIPLPRGNRGWNVVTSGPTATPSRSLETTLPLQSMRRHVVRRGETLSGLAARYLGSSARFDEIYRANRDVLRHPNDLRVGMTIRIPARSAMRPGSSQVTRGKPRNVRSPIGRTKANGRIPARSVSRETKSHAAGDKKRQPRRHSNLGSWFVPVRHSPFVRRPRRRSTKRSPKRSPKRSRKKLTQTPPAGLPTRSKHGASPRR